MSALKYCMKCGRETLQWDGEKKWSCSECDFSLFHNVAGAVAVLIKYNDEILFTRRSQEPMKGKLDLPGGFVDPKESAEVTCVREISEELSYNIDPSGLKHLGSLPNVYHYNGIDYNTLDLFYEYATDQKFDVELDLAEVSETVWLKPENLDLEDLAFESQKLFLSGYLKHLIK